MTMTLAKSKLSVADRESFIFEPPKDFLESVQSDPPSEVDIQNSGKLRAYRLLCEGLARIRHADKRHWHHRPVYRVRNSILCFWSVQLYVRLMGYNFYLTTTSICDENSKPAFCIKFTTMLSAPRLKS